ncbi:MAG: hypothetical protein JWM68_3587 [Verrucomicrobiales bacterium]|nr:hypothetical protein [Verrucomicrobiales bacterium]
MDFRLGLGVAVPLYQSQRSVLRNILVFLKWLLEFLFLCLLLPQGELLAVAEGPAVVAFIHVLAEACFFADLSHEFASFVAPLNSFQLGGVIEFDGLVHDLAHRGEMRTKE